MNGANICVHCERLYAAWPPEKGWVTLLDMDKIICRRDNTLEVVSIDECYYCETMEWGGTQSAHPYLDKYDVVEEHDAENRTKCEHCHCRE